MINMVDFKKRLGKQIPQKITDPIALYDTLDRASDKGPLRPSQESILSQWYNKYFNVNDIILKMHTGQGKTLVGLLMLQSKLNAKQGPSLYLCANNFLVKQTQDQAKQFGLSVCTTEDDLPTDFLQGRKILITTVHKLFNGLTKFGLGNKAIKVDSIVFDDAHACVDAIRNTFIIRIDKKDSAYSRIRDLFSDELEKQGVGTFADILKGKYNAMLPVAYWAWQSRISEVADILSDRSDAKAIKFIWPLLKDRLEKCQCIISGEAIEIAPYLPPIHLFRSFAHASCRIFMSATVADDSFLVKGLGLSPEVIKNPLTYEKEKWSGEKMIIIPSLVDESVDRGTILDWLGKTRDNRRFGVVALVPSFKHAENWEAHGAIIAKSENIDEEIEKLRSGKYDQVVVITNRYDGIDLPDDSCRILIFDSEPYSESLIDFYMESCRPNSETTAIRKSRTIEQGLGRSVRGERDYCTIIIIGPDLIKCIQSEFTRGHLSKQTQLQIEIGFEIAEMAKDDLNDTSNPLDVIKEVILQSLRRDPSWKAFYANKMESVEHEQVSGKGLKAFSRELKAEQLHEHGDSQGAVKEIQALIDECITDEEEVGWYLQEMARFSYAFSITESEKIQRNAHLKNHTLLKPPSGIQIDPIIVISQKRIENIITWIEKHKNYKEFYLTINNMLNCLNFGIDSDKFEGAFDQLGNFLGFISQRPEKYWKEGPDNLWGLRENEYLLIECKSEVDQRRSEIEASEAIQMNKSCAWFDSIYKDAKCLRWIVIPTRKITRKSSFTHDVMALKKSGLIKLVNNVKRFSEHFKDVDFRDLSERHIQGLINTHHLTVDDISTMYAERIILSS